MPMPTTRSSLLASATRFCQTFAAQSPLDEILSHFSTSQEPLIIEYGLPQLAPFLGREFVGSNGVKEYFDLLSSLLKYEDMRFDNYVVDAEESKVSVRGKAIFTWSRTNQSWAETFTYVLAFDQQGKVKSYEVWADSGAAFLASRGEL